MIFLFGGNFSEKVSLKFLTGHLPYCCLSYFIHACHEPEDCLSLSYSFAQERLIFAAPVKNISPPLAKFVLSLSMSWRDIRQCLLLVPLLGLPKLILVLEREGLAKYVCSNNKSLFSYQSIHLFADGDSILFYSILFYSILFYSILFYSILFYSILFYSILFYSILFCSILHF